MRGAISYLDFDLLIRRAENGYRAQVLSSPEGQATADFSLPFSELELENFVLRIGRPRRGTRRIDSPEMEVAKNLGGRLYEAVFSGDLRACWRASVGEAETQNLGLRLRLRIGDAPELNEIPWEYLYNTHLNQFLSLSVYTPLIRYLELPERIRPLAVDGPLKILVLISSPTDPRYGGLNVSSEWSRLNEALTEPKRSGQVQLDLLAEATLSALRTKLRGSEYHILHFIGHGGFDRETQEGVLVLCDEAGGGRLVGAQRLGTILRDRRSLRLVVLNACEGSRATRADPFAGVAQTIVQQGVPAVIAMQFEITDQAAITFAKEFYTAIADDYPVDAALSEARIGIHSDDNDIEWGTPVLYLRAPNGQLFSVDRDGAAFTRTEEERLRAEAARQAEEEKQRAEMARLAEEEKQRAEAVRPATASRDRDLADLAIFRDAAFAPELVVIPASEFMMGSTEEEEGYVDNEGPRHRVTIARRFAIGRYPVIFDEYDRFCEAMRREKPGDERWGRKRRPVIDVNWHDAQDYIAWLSQETGKAYRLPSEAEWEYACRAGTPTRYSFGDTITLGQANYSSGFSKTVYSGRTSEVGAYPANPWGLYDMHGNVWEWVEDHWHENYGGAPSDGSAWKDLITSSYSQYSHRYVSRGGSWRGSSWDCRSALRGSVGSVLRSDDVGFRVARALS